MNPSNGHPDLLKLPIEERVGALRDLLGVTQAELADELGMNVRQVKRWQRGELPSEESARKLAALAPRKLRARAEWFYEPRERREERMLALERRVEQMERRLKRAGL